MTVTRENPHIDYNIITKIYHLKGADLVDKYTPRGGRVLDIGCGAGNMLVEVQKKRPDLILDISDAYQISLDVTSQRVDVDAKYLLPEREFDVSQITTRYDTCIMSHLLEHVQTPVKAIQDVLRLLTPGGTLILIVPNSVNPRNFVAVGLQRRKVNPGHCFHWDQGHWKNFLENIAKVHVIEYGNDEVFLFSRYTPLTSPLKRFELFLGKFFPGWSFSHIAVVTSGNDSNA